MKRSWLLILLILGACRPDASPKRTVNQVPIRRLTPGGAPAQHSGLTFATRTVVDDATTFARLWREAFASPGDTVPPPAVDWAREKVVFAGLGNRPSGGYVVGVTAAVQTADELQVTIETTSPGRDCMNAAVITQPADVVTIPRPKPGVIIRFIERERTGDCP